MTDEFQDFLTTDPVHADTMNIKVVAPANALKNRVDTLVLHGGYGIQWNPDADVITRVGEAMGLTRSDFDTIAPWKDIKRCVVADDGTVVYYLDPSDSALKDDGSTPSVLDGTDGQVMVEIPKFYYRSRPHEYWVSSEPLTGYQIHPAFIRNGVIKDYIYLSAFEGFYSSSDEAMQSIADVVPSTVDGTSDGGLTPIAAYPDTTSETHGFDSNGGDIRNCRYWAQERGTGWEQQDFLTTCAIQLLYIVEYADWDTQSIIGRGVVDKSLGNNNNADKTGATISLGNVSGRESGTDGLTSVSYRGIENFWGNIWKWVDGINLTGDEVDPNYTTWVADYDFESDKHEENYINIGVYVNTGASWGNLEGIAFNDGYSFLASDVGGTDYDSHLHDAFYSRGQGRVALFGGAWPTGSRAGAFCWALDTDSSTSRRNTGARLLKF